MLLTNFKDAKLTVKELPEDWVYDRNIALRACRHGDIIYVHDLLNAMSSGKKCAKYVVKYSKEIANYEVYRLFRAIQSNEIAYGEYKTESEKTFSLIARYRVSKLGFSANKLKPLAIAKAIASGNTIDYYSKDEEETENDLAVILVEEPEKITSISCKEVDLPNIGSVYKVTLICDDALREIIFNLSDLDNQYVCALMRKLQKVDNQCMAKEKIKQYIDTAQGRYGTCLFDIDIISNLNGSYISSSEYCLTPYQAMKIESILSIKARKINDDELYTIDKAENGVIRVGLRNYVLGKTLKSLIVQRKDVKITKANYKSINEITEVLKEEKISGYEKYIDILDKRMQKA